MFIEAKVQSRRDVTNFGKAAMSQDKGRVILMFLRMRAMCNCCQKQLRSIIHMQISCNNQNIYVAILLSQANITVESEKTLLYNLVFTYP